jgi:hypothetical protein
MRECCASISRSSPVFILSINPIFACRSLLTAIFPIFLRNEFPRKYCIKTTHSESWTVQKRYLVQTKLKRGEEEQDQELSKCACAWLARHSDGQLCRNTPFGKRHRGAEILDRTQQSSSA